MRINIEKVLDVVGDVIYHGSEKMVVALGIFIPIVVAVMLVVCLHEVARYKGLGCWISLCILTLVGIGAFSYALLFVISLFRDDL